MRIFILSLLWIVSVLGTVGIIIYVRNNVRRVNEENKVRRAEPPYGCAICVGPVCSHIEAIKRANSFD